MGVVSRLGDPLTKLVYDTIFDFRESMAIVGSGHRAVNQFGKVSSDFKYGYLTKGGRLVVPIKFESLYPYREGLGLIDEIKPYGGSTHTYYNKQGRAKLVIRDVYDVLPFQGGLAYAEVPHTGFRLPVYNDGRNNGNHTQLYDVNGETIYGNYIDRSGRLLVPWKYDTIAPYQSGYLRPVRKNGEWGFLDSLAQVAVPLQYDDIDTDSSFFWQTLRRVGQGGAYGFLNPKTGRLAIPLRYEATLSSQRPVVWVRQHGQWGLINARQTSIIPPHYDEATPFDRQGLAVIKKGYLYGLVNEQGRELTPVQYERMLPFQEERAVVKRAGRFGFITEDGREVIPAVYNEVSPFTNGRAFAKRWGLFVTLDPDGNWLGWKLQTITLQWILAGLALLTGLGGWVWQHNRCKSLTNA